MEYVAFKALKSIGSSLVSPKRGTVWEQSPGGARLEALNSATGLPGIYAASWAEAAEYGDDIYLVVPYFLSDPEADFVLGESGWRSTRATVIGGPYSAEDGLPREIAEQIVGWAAAGYEQVPAVLADAIDGVYPRSGDTLIKMAELGLDGHAAIAAVAPRISSRALFEIAARGLPVNPVAAWALLFVAGLVPGPADVDELDRALSHLGRDERRQAASAVLEEWEARLIPDYSMTPQIVAFARLFPDLSSDPEIVARFTSFLRGDPVFWPMPSRLAVLDALAGWPETISNLFRDAARWVREDAVSSLHRCWGMSWRPVKARAIILGEYRRRLGKLLGMRPGLRGFAEPTRLAIHEMGQTIEAVFSLPEGERYAALPDFLS